MSTSSLPLFGRAYSLTVTLPANPPGSGQKVLTLSSSGFEPEALRITFDVQMAAFRDLWYMDCSIFNLSQATTKDIVGGLITSQQDQANGQPIEQGMWCRLDAGYVAGQNAQGGPNSTGLYGTIWEGPVFQALYSRENGVDLRLELLCLLGLDQIARSQVNVVYPPGLTQTEILQNLIRDTTYPGTPMQVGTISPNIDASKTIRHTTVFGHPSNYFDRLSQSQNMQWWLSRRGFNMGTPQEDLELSTTPPLVYSPPSLPAVNTAGPPTPAAQGVIIGSPTQTQQGFSFRTLLDPRVEIEKPLRRVQIKNSNLRLQKIEIGQYPGFLDSDLIGIVGAARFIGDSRGQDWYTDVTAFTIVGNRLAWEVGQLISQTPDTNE